MCREDFRINQYWPQLYAALAILSLIGGFFMLKSA